MSRIVLLILTLSLSLGTFAAHLVGGEITYTCLGNNNYQIKLRIYRDCFSTGADFDPNAAVTIFDSQGNIVRNLAIPRGQIFPLPATVNNPCLQSPPSICTEYTDYLTTVNLPPITGGYTITHQRCCRNNTISNIPNPGDWGNTYTINIPSNDNCNSAPEFTSEPPIVLCLNDPLNINSSVQEPDGDSLYYELCHPFHGGGTDTPPTGTDCLTCPAPNPAGSPPYFTVPFIPPSSASDPIPSNPAITIDPNTGIITGTPTVLGQFVFAVCVREYRNGVFLSTVRRDYQFNVTNCSSNVSSAIIAQDNTPNSICVGRTINFQEDAINAVTYHWNFGDPNTLADTSNQPNPTYTYADTGTYTVTLTVNKGYPCEDIATATFRVHNPVNFTINRTGNPCFDIQNILFSAAGNFSDEAIFTWQFPAAANIQSHNTESPPPITFNALGTYYVSLTVEDFGCEFTYGDSITISRRPEFDATIPPTVACAPYTLDLQHSAISEVPVIYEWRFGDGSTSNLPNPEYTFDTPGIYSGYLLMYTNRGCTDSARFDFQIQIFPSPDFDLRVDPTKTDIFNPIVRIFVENVSPNDDFIVYTGDGATYPNQTEVLHRYGDTGWFDIRVFSQNEFGCEREKVFPFRVAPIPLIYTPDAFTPNGDGLNDLFRSYSSGYKQFRIDVFDRWGNLVYQSFDAYEWWDGTDINNGKDCAEGTYVWIVKFLSTEGEYIERKGTVTLMR